MTAQISDEFIYKGREFDVAGVNGEGLFDPAQHRLTPVAVCTACWRGYQCVYEIRDGQLLLQMLRINHGKAEGDFGQPIDAPPLWGRRPTSEGGEVRMFHSTYKDLGHLVEFTGGLLLASGFIEELYVHMGFHPAWKFREVHELHFKKGKVTKEADRSHEIARVREGMRGKGEYEDPKKLAAWIERCFSLKYEW